MLMIVCQEDARSNEVTQFNNDLEANKGSYNDTWRERFMKPLCQLKSQAAQHRMHSDTAKTLYDSIDGL